MSHDCAWVCTGLEKEVRQGHEHVSKFQEDFDYNLALLKSRDQELAHYETAFVDLKRVINAVVVENSELKVSLSKK